MNLARVLAEPFMPVSTRGTAVDTRVLRAPANRDGETEGRWERQGERETRGPYVLAVIH